MNSKNPLPDYFTFSRKDRLAALFFILVVGGLLAVPAFLPRRPPALAPLPDSLLRPVDRTPADRNAASSREGGTAREQKTFTDRDAWKRSAPFPFDPNSLDAAGWQRLGLPDRTIRTILKYRDRGGRFRKPEDLGKIWSLPPGFVERVLPYIRIGQPGGSTPATHPPAYPYPDRRPPARTLLSINEADSSAWEALPGIGARLAGRILRFRERLGGFVSVQQVGETFGLPDSTFRKIEPLLQLKSTGNTVIKLNLNTATLEELRAHPYIRWKIANSIVNYRKAHGLFSSVEDLQKLLILPDSSYKKLAPYVLVD